MEDQAQPARRPLADELDELRIDVIRLAALTTEAIAGGTAGVARQRPQRGRAVIEADDVIDELTHPIEDRVPPVLATQPPVARPTSASSSP